VLGPRGQYIHDNRVVILTITVINYSSLLGILECDDGGCDEMMILGSSTLCIQLSIVLPFCYALTCGQNCRIYFTARCEGFDFFLCVRTLQIVARRKGHGGYIWILSFKS
jgi:hypothetical protein